MARLVSERSDVLPALAEAFRQHGFEGASLARIQEATGLGKGSLYHFFPGGKEEMARAVLSDIDQWFQDHVFTPLEACERSDEAVNAMFDSIERYFRSGARTCLVGALALDGNRERFQDRIDAYFRRWVAALAGALMRGGRSEGDAVALAEDVVAGIQGALVLARALVEPEAFTRVLHRIRERIQVLPEG